jgi:hypothetical protein
MTLAAQTLKPHFGSPLYDEMREHFDYSQIVWTMRRYNPEMTEDRANQLLDAFLQWISLAPLNTPAQWITMFKTDVEEAFHCFVLNTRLYRDFCNRFLGFFFHHDPLVEESGPEIDAAARFTLENLEQSFGSGINPEFKEWRRQYENGTYQVACAGPGGSC